MAGDARFSDVRRMLEAHGWRLTRVRGSHHIFTKRGRRPVPMPVHRGKVEPVYVRLVEKICAEEERGDR